MICRRGIGVVLVVTCWMVAASVGAAELPSLAVPDALGVNIHFTDPQPGEMKMLAEGGFRWVRMDFNWDGIEREKGKYDFIAYDRLLASLAPHKIRAVLILDYSNRHYDNGLSPASDEGRKAFARWAAAAAQHFRGKGVLWEMYNEPNIGFWKPTPDVHQYVKLALEVGKALREAAPDEAYIGPATSEIDLRFLEECFKAGLLDYWSAVSVHPYRQSAPETASAEYATLRRLIAKYAPKGKTIPIISGEWGYSSGWKNFDDVKQGRLLPRQWLVNLSNDVPVSIWYDWHDDGTDPKEPEHHFGTVHHESRAGTDPIYEPKPAYRAAKTLTTVLGGYRFSKRLVVDDQDDYVLLFTNGSQTALVAWTTSATPRTVFIPTSPGRFRVTSHLGEELPAVAASSKGLTLLVDDAPRYLVPDSPNDLLRIAADWQRAPQEIVVHGPKKAEITTRVANPLHRSIRVVDSRRRSVVLGPGETGELAATVEVLRTEQPTVVRLVCQVDQAAPLVQTARVVAANPLALSIGPPVAKGVVVRVENPSSEPLDGVVRLTGVRGLHIGQPSAELRLTAGEKEKDVRFEVRDDHVKRFQFGVRVEDAGGRLQTLAPVAPMALVDDFSKYTSDTVTRAWQMAPDGDPKVASTQSVTASPIPSGLEPPGTSGLKIAYRMDKGWKFIRLTPKTEDLAKIEGRPKSAAFWVYGDGSRNLLRLRFVDAACQTFQPSGPAMTWKGWRLVTMPMDGTSAGHWGGSNDGVVRYPIRWDSLLLIDGIREKTDPLEVFVGSAVLVYPEPEPAAKPVAKPAAKKGSR